MLAKAERRKAAKGPEAGCISIVMSTETRAASGRGGVNEWPSLRVEDWAETRDALHLWSQIVGKIKLAKTPLVNHWWNVTFLVAARGLTTGVIPDGARIFEMEFDMVHQRLHIVVLDGARRVVDLRAMSVAAFYEETLHALDDLGVEVDIYPVPVELEVAVPFAEDTRVRDYRPQDAHTFWLQLVQASRVMGDFRSGFVGKVSPVHFFWGSLDLAVTRFSGRPAPRHPGGAPNCPDWVMVEAYSHEVASCGFWPGGGEEGAFYAYAYPEPDGYPQAAVQPSQAAYSQELRQFLLPYEAVRSADDPDAAALAFFESTYAAAAELGGWDPSLVAARARR
jgi:Family of unknown function (DUF5996)